MLTSSLNSKKCSTTDRLWLSFAAGIALFAVSHAHAAVPKSPPLIQSLKQDLENREKQKSAKFEALIAKWEKQHGSKAFDPLLSIAMDRRNEDPNRYVALMGAAKLGGKEAAPFLVPLLKDKSWMMRSGALRALRVLAHPRTSAAVLPLLNDKALVVRLEAVEAVQLLKPEGSEPALLSAIQNPANYHGGKAQWVPQRALRALVSLKAKNAAPKLIPLLENNSDPALQRETITTLEALTGKTLKRGKPLSEQIKEWKSHLSARRS